MSTISCDKLTNSLATYLSMPKSKTFCNMPLAILQPFSDKMGYFKSADLCNSLGFTNCMTKCVLQDYTFCFQHK